MLPKITRSTRRVIALLLLTPAIVLLLGLLYMLGMTYLEGQPRTYLRSVMWASETLTTTGYGSDNQWTHPAMALLIITTQFLGQALSILILPVLFYRFSPAIESVLDEFINTNSPFVIFEEDMVLARSLRDKGCNVVFGKLGNDPTAFASVRDARAVVCNGDDHSNATCTLIVREMGFKGSLFSLTDNPVYRTPMLQIGATEVFTPSHVLGAALASRGSIRISPPAEGMHLLGAKVGMAEFRVRAGSPLAGQRLCDLELRDKYSVSIIGQWLGGVFTTSKGRDSTVEAGAILVVVGAPENLEKVERMAMPIRREGPIVVAGFGMVGCKVVEMLQDAGETCIVIDQDAAEGVNVVGNVLEQDTLKRAKARDASAIILALSDDSESVFATAVVRDYAPEVPLIVRVLRTPNTERIYRAGADFAVSVGQVAGQILAYHLLGEHPWKVDALERTGAKVVAVERRGQVLVTFPHDFVVKPDDSLFVCGSHHSLERFRNVFQVIQF